MPTVPIAQGPQIQRDAYRAVEQRPLDVSSGLQTVAKAAGMAGEVADRVVVREAEAKADQVDAEITAGWLKWDAENRRKYQGQNVDQYEAEAAKWWDEAAKTYGPELSPLARARVGQTLARKRTQALGSVVSYAGAERERHADDAAEAAAQASIEFGVDTGDTAGAAERVRQIAATKGARKGWTTEQVQADQQRLLGTLHLGYITRMAERDPAKAQEYYQANKGEIPAAAQARVEEVLKGEGDNQFATQFAAKHAGLPLSEQLAKAAEITDPERREKTLLQIRNNHAMVEQAKREREAAASDSAWQLASQGRRVPETVLMQMNGRERAQLKDWLREKAKQAAEGVSPKTDWATYIDVRERLAAGENVDLRKLTTKIAPAQMEQLLDVKTKATQPAKQDALFTDEQRVNQTLVGLGIDKEKDPETAGLISQEIDRRIRAESAARGGKDLTADEKQKIIDGVALDKVYVEEWGRDPQTPLALVAPEDLDKAYVVVEGKNVKVSSVPGTDREEIIRSLRRRGLPVTEQKIVETYLKAKRLATPEGRF